MWPSWTTSCLLRWCQRCYQNYPNSPTTTSPSSVCSFLPEYHSWCVRHGTFSSLISFSVPLRWCLRIELFIAAMWLRWICGISDGFPANAMVSGKAIWQWYSASVLGCVVEYLLFLQTVFATEFPRAPARGGAVGRWAGGCFRAKAREALFQGREWR